MIEENVLDLFVNAQQFIPLEWKSVEVDCSNCGVAVKNKTSHILRIEFIKSDDSIDFERPEYQNTRKPHTRLEGPEWNDLKTNFSHILREYVDNRKHAEALGQRNDCNKT